MKNYILFTLIFSFSYSTVINVPSDYSTIQAGIDASADGDTILVDQGDYYENLYLDKEILLGSNAIYDDLGNLWELNQNIVNTVVYGYDPVTGVGGSCIDIVHENIQPIIKGFTFTQGRGSAVSEVSCGPDNKISGGAIMIFRAYPTINYNRFLNNGSANSSEQEMIVNEGGAIVHYDDSDVEFDEDRSISVPKNSRTIPETMDFRYNYYSQNTSSMGSSIFSDFEGSIDVGNSVFDYIDCNSDEANRYTLGTKAGTTTYLQDNVDGNCIDIDTVYVATDGDNYNAGTYDSPFKTITYALQLVRDNSTTVIKVSPGNYSPGTNGESFPLVIKNNTHLIGLSKENTILDAQATEGKQRRVIEIYDGQQFTGENDWIADNILVKNFTITGGYHVDDNCIGGGGILIGDPVNISLSGLPFVDPRPVLDNLRIVDNIANGGGAIFAYTGLTFKIKNSEILYNTTYGTNAGGLITAGIGLFASSIEIDKTLFTDLEGSAINQYGEYPIIIKNSTFANIGSVGSFSSITNSILYEVGNGDGPCLGTYSLNYHSENSCNTENEGNLISDPIFIDLENDNFRLQPISPAIDAGTTDIDSDGDGVNDIIDYFGLAPDMGAFEHVLTPPEGFEFHSQNSSVILTWNHVEDNNLEYYILGKADNENFDDQIELHFTTNVYEDNTLDYDTEYFYRVSYFDGVFNSPFSDTLSVILEWMKNDKNSQVPLSFLLHQNYPNPFNPTTTLQYDLPEESIVNITIYDLLGNTVRELVNQKENSGFKSIKWDATNHYGESVSGGVYLYSIEAGDFIQAKKMILLK